MACKYVFTESAAAEYDSILSYLVVDCDNLQAAQHFQAEFSRIVDLVCDNPELFALSRMPQIARLGYRPMLVLSYIALYQFEKGVITIGHVFHQSQDYARLV